MRAVVLGAGPAGLAAAQALLDGGAEVVVVEAGASVGGLAGSRRVGTHLVDLGPHRLHEEASAEVRALIGGDAGLVRRARVGRIRLGSRAVDYPLTPCSALRGLGARKAAAFLGGALLARLNPDDGSYAGGAQRRVGRPVFEALYGPAARKIWGEDPRVLDAEQARARVGAQGPCSLIGRLVGRGEPGGYFYPAAGANGSAYDAWARRLTARGVRLLCNSRAVEVAHQHAAVSSIAVERDGERSWLSAERVVSTLPVPQLLQALAPRLALPAGPELRFRSVVLLHVVLDRARLGAQDVNYFPDSTVPFARMTEQTAFGRVAGARSDETVITLDFYDWQGGPLTCASPEQLFDLAAPHLARLGIARRDVRLLAKTVADNAYPVFHKGYASLRARCLDAVSSIEGLLSTGRAGLFLHVNQHHAVEMGLAAGRTALCSTHTSTRWREAAKRFEAVRVVD